MQGAVGKSKIAKGAFDPRGMDSVCVTHGFHFVRPRPCWNQEYARARPLEGNFGVVQLVIGPAPRPDAIDPAFQGGWHAPPEQGEHKAERVGAVYAGQRGRLR